MVNNVVGVKKEVERKFLLNLKSEEIRNLSRSSHITDNDRLKYEYTIKQAYLSDPGDDFEISIRKAMKKSGEEPNWIDVYNSIRIKSKPGISREEFELQISPSTFENLWNVKNYGKIFKKRYSFSHREGTHGINQITIDVFYEYDKRENEFVMVEIEFKNLESAEKFDPNVFESYVFSYFRKLGREVTNDERYYNKNIAIKFPKESNSENVPHSRVVIGKRD